MMKKIEQAESRAHVSKRGETRISVYHRYLKHAGRRVMRRLGKQLLDDAPRRLPLRGYET